LSELGVLVAYDPVEVVLFIEQEFSVNPSSRADSTTIFAVIRDLKYDASHDEFPVRLMWNDEIVGQLRPLHYIDAENDDLLVRLKNWRNQHRTAFFTQFEATVESTRNWLRTLILDRPDRILFLITDSEYRPIGHCGACNICSESAELDAFIRGEQLGHGMLMVLAARTLLRWLFDRLGVSRAYCRVFDDNVSAIRLFQSLGLTIAGRETVSMIAEEELTRYEPASHLESESGRKVAYLELGHDRYCAIAPRGNGNR